jgi:hypothetical protein
MPRLRFSAWWLACGLVIMSLASCADDDGAASDGDADDDNQFTDDDDDDNDNNDDDDNDDTSAPEYPEPCADGPTFTFDLASTPMVVPFPNDWYAVDDAASPTGRRVHIDADTARPIGAMAANPLLGFLTNAFNNLTGFSPLADLYVPAGTEPAAASLPDDLAPGLADGVFLLVDDPTSPRDGTFGPLRLEWRAPDLHLTPWFPLKENTHYVVVATRALHPGDGCYRASDSMRDAWTAWATDAKDRYTATLDRLAALGLAPEQILSVADFTTGWVTRDLEAAKLVLDELAQTEPSPFYDWAIVPDADPRLFATAHATFDVPIFKAPRGAWSFDADGRPAIDHVESVLAYFTLPAADAHPDGQPYPILLFEHGMFNDKHEMRPPFTTEIAAQGFAMVAIDAVCHGDRLPPGMGEIGQFFCFYDIFHPEAWRDNFRESVANLAWLTSSLKTLADADLDSNGVPDFDVERIYSLGMSFGSILDGAYAALEDRIDAHVVAAAGAKLTSVALEGEAAQYFELIELIEHLFWPDEPITDFLNLFTDMLQAVLDPADSANYLVHVIDDPLPLMQGHVPQVFQQGSGYDATIGGPSGGWLCRAAGWPQITPFAWDVGTAHVEAPYFGSAFFQFDTDEHTLIFDDHELGIAARAQVIHFLRTHLDNGVGEIVDPL